MSFQGGRIIELLRSRPILGLLFGGRGLGVPAELPEVAPVAPIERPTMITVSPPISPVTRISPPITVSPLISPDIEARVIGAPITIEAPAAAPIQIGVTVPVELPAAAPAPIIVTEPPLPPPLDEPIERIREPAPPPEEIVEIIPEVRELMVIASVSPNRGVPPLFVTFNATASGGLPPYTYVWNFGDPRQPRAGGVTRQTNWSYLDPGPVGRTQPVFIQATVSVTDAIGRRTQASVQIQLDPQPITAPPPEPTTTEPVRTPAPEVEPVEEQFPEQFDFRRGERPLLTMLTRLRSM